MEIMKKVLSLALAVLLIASVIVSVPITASAFNADNYKANITKISVGAPITGTDEKKYLPVCVQRQRIVKRQLQNIFGGNM